MQPLQQRGCLAAEALGQPEQRLQGDEAAVAGRWAGQGGVEGRLRGHQVEQPMHVVQEQLALAELLATQLQGLLVERQGSGVVSGQKGARTVQNQRRSVRVVPELRAPQPDVLKTAGEQIVVQQHRPDGGETRHVLSGAIMVDQRAQIRCGHPAVGKHRQLALQERGLDGDVALEQPVGGERDRGKQHLKEIHGRLRRIQLVVAVPPGDELLRVVRIDRRPDLAMQAMQVRF